LKHFFICSDSGVISCTEEDGVKKGFLYSILSYIYESLIQINSKLDDIKYDFSNFSKVSGCGEVPHIERISWKDEVDLTVIINQFKSMVKECVQWKNNSINKIYVSMNNSITILNLFFDNFLLEFNSRLWKSELHLVLNAFNNQISKKRLFPLFFNSDGSCKKLNQFLAFFSSSYLGALIMVSIFYFCSTNIFLFVVVIFVYNIKKCL